MGLSSKQVSSKRSSMKRQPHEQQGCEPLKCPRCDSTNTKFCYFNNYNESQPRHYCRACKRHWTKGGSLRNVPVGGGRKNRRIKKNAAPTTVASAAATNGNTRRITTPSTCNSKPSTDIAIQDSQQILYLPLVPDGQKNFLYQPLTHPAPLLLQHGSTNSTCDLNDKFCVGSKNDTLMGTTAMTLPEQLQSHCLQFPFSSSSNCDTNLSSITTVFQSSNVYDHGDEFKTIDEPTITSMIMSSSSGDHAQPWQVPNIDNGIDIASSWNWDDIDSLVSIDHSTSWKDTDLKP